MTLAFFEGLDRGEALVLLCFGVAAFAFGARYARLQTALLLAIAGWFLGKRLAILMFVPSWTVSAPAALIGGAVGRLLERAARVVCLASLGGWLLGLWAVQVFPPAFFWGAFVVGALLAGGFAALTPVFSSALLFAAIATMLILVMPGYVVRASTGPLAPGGFARYPQASVILGAALFLGSTILQGLLGPEDLPELSDDEEESM